MSLGSEGGNCAAKWTRETVIWGGARWLGQRPKWRLGGSKVDTGDSESWGDRLLDLVKLSFISLN